MHDRERLLRALHASLTDEDCPDTDTLAGYVLGTLSGTHQLQIAAHARSCPLCAADAHAATPQQPTTTPLFARLVSLPMSAALRSSQITVARRYVAANVSIDLSLAPPDGEVWRLTGQALLDGEPLIGGDVVLSSSDYSGHETTDTLGFFVFERVPSGVLELSLVQGGLRVVVSDLRLDGEQDRP